MNNKLTLFNLRQKVYRFMMVGIYPIICGVFVLLLCIQIYSVYTVWSDLQVASSKRDTLASKLAKYRNNARISDTERVAYGTIIKKQVPKVNDVFDQFNLIDIFYQRTGIELKGASSPRGKGSSSRAASNASTGTTNYLIGSGTMNEETLNELMSLYQYQFHRFMTLDEITVAVSKEGQGRFYDVALTLQLYNLGDANTSGDTASTGEIQFTSKDLESFQAYMDKTNIDIYYEMQSASPVTTEYETAESIF